VRLVKITVGFADGEQMEFQAPITVAEALMNAGIADGENTIAARVNGILVDLSYILTQDTKLEPVYADSKEGHDILRHSIAHIMAQAVQQLYPGTKLGIGPTIEDGFYYDFDRSQPFSDSDLEEIERKINHIIEQDLPFSRRVLGKEDALKLFTERGEDYKLELINELDNNELNVYQQGEFIDLCRGPHIPSTGKVRAFKLLSVAGAYWRGDEKNKMLQRIYGTAFSDRSKLKEYLARLEEAKRRDHRKLGQELDLFSISPEAGAGLVIYHPKGAVLRSVIEDFEKREHLRRGYQLVVGPQLLKMDLWQKSGHYDNYRENMYFTEIEGQKYGIKPMNCLAHMLIYKSRLRSYRDLPLRYFELGTVYRHEKTGVLHGLLRVRGFTQDDAHILCTPEQLNAEIVGVIDFVQTVMGIFGFSYDIEVSTRPEKSIGSDEDWERATNALYYALDSKGLPYSINQGDGAFYGPKIDVKLKDALGRSWQCATIQCDFTLPERFDLCYIGEDGQRHRPVMLHRVILGALERFMGVLIEHYAGAFPVWLAPVQVIIMSISDKQDAYAQNLAQKLMALDIRVETDIRREKIGLKIREAQMQKIPYMLIVGAKEEARYLVAVRERSMGDMGSMELEEFLHRIKMEIDNKKN
jgi:threonyl-tRNA synthetase